MAGDDAHSLELVFHERLGDEYFEECGGKRAYTTETAKLVEGATATQSGRVFTRVYATTCVAATENVVWALPVPCHGILSIGEKEFAYDLPAVQEKVSVVHVRGEGDKPVSAGTIINNKDTPDVSALPETTKIVAWATKQSDIVVRVTLKRRSCAGTAHRYTPTGEIYSYYPYCVQVWRH